MSDDITVDEVIMDHGTEDVFDEVIEEGEFNESQEVIEEDSGEAAESSESVESEDSDKSDEPEVKEDAEATEESEEAVSEDASESDKQDSEAKEAEAKVEDKESEEAEEGGDQSSLIDVKIDGEVQQFSQEEVIAKGKEMLAGQIAFDKKFTELDKERQSYKQQVNEVNGYVNTFGEKVRSGDAIEAMQYLGEFAGIPPYMIKEQILQQALPELLKRQDMSPQEVQQEILNGQEAHLNKQQESNAEQAKQEQANQELRSSIDSHREAHEIGVEEWDNTLQLLDQTLEQGETITPDMIKDAVLDGRRVDRAERILQGFELELSDNSINDLADIQEKYPEFTDDQLKEVVQIALDQEKRQEVEAKQARKAKKQGTAKKVVAKQTQQEVETIDPELEDWL
jgi:hypothetical protein